MIVIASRHFYCHRLCLLLIILLSIQAFSSPVYADGGAPQLAYVAGTAQGISIVDIARQHVTGTITSGGNPQGILLSLDGHALYVSQPTMGQVAVIDVKAKKPLCAVRLPDQPSLLALSLDASVLYAAGQGGPNVYALNPITCAIERTFETHEPVYGLAVAASTAADATPLTPNQIWIAGTTSLTVFEANGHLLGTVPVSGGPQYISIPAGFTAYVTTRQGTVVAVDLNTRHVIQTLLSDGLFGPMDYDATTGDVYVPDKQHNQLDVLTPVTAGSTLALHEPVRIIHLSSSPQSVAITSDGQLGFVALANAQVLMLDIPGRRIVTSITVGGSPHFIITGLYPPEYSSTSSPQQTTTSSTSSSLSGHLFFIFSMILLVVLLLSAIWLFWRRYQK